MTQSIDTRHPLYLHMVDDWQLMQDSLDEKAIKKAGTRYLPATYGMVQRGMSTNQEGSKEYEAYKMRAIFHELVAVALEAMVGIINKKPLAIKVPTQLEPMLENFTKRGYSIHNFARKMNEEQLLHGRLGMLVDIPDNAAVDSMPYIVQYSARSIINWSDVRIGENDKLELVVLDETRQKIDMSTYAWEREERFKVLTVNDGLYTSFNEVAGLRQPDQIPSLGGNTLSDIPFVFCGANDNDSHPDRIPLISLARTAIAIYRGEADYRRTLFKQGDDTLVTIGDEGSLPDAGLLGGDANGLVNVEDYGRASKIEVGAGARIHVPMGGDAKYIGVNSNGLLEQREALENLHKMAADMGFKLLNNTGGGKEAAEALKIRLIAQTASLTQVAQTGAAALQRALQYAAMFKGLNPDEIEVKPNLDFSDAGVSADEINKLMDAKLKGAPLSSRTIHSVAVVSGLTPKTYEQEREEMEEDDDSMLIPSTVASRASAEPDPMDE